MKNNTRLTEKTGLNLPGLNGFLEYQNVDLYLIILCFKRNQNLLIGLLKQLRIYQSSDTKSSYFGNKNNY